MRIILNGCRPETYINSGVLLMNLERIRQYGNLFQNATDWMLRKRRVALAPNQDALNAIFADDIKIISSRFNQNVWKPDMTDCVIHMLFSKAWVFSKGLYSEQLYWKMYLQSAWGENTTRNELIDIFVSIAYNTSNTPQANLPSYTYCFLRTLRGCAKLLLKRIIPVRAIKYIIYNIYYDIKYRLAQR